MGACCRKSKKESESKNESKLASPMKEEQLNNNSKTREKDGIKANLLEADAGKDDIVDSKQNPNNNQERPNINQIELQPKNPNIQNSQQNKKTPDQSNIKESVHNPIERVHIQQVHVKDEHKPKAQIAVHQPIVNQDVSVNEPQQIKKLQIPQGKLPMGFGPPPVKIQKDLTVECNDIQDILISIFERPVNIGQSHRSINLDLE